MQKRIIFLLFFFLPGCASIGPGRVNIDRGIYNNALRQTEQEQLLTNIVRGRYLEVSQYLQVTNLTASYSLGEKVQGNYGNLTATGVPAAWGSAWAPALSYSDTPTISYVPLSSVEFAKSLMAPVTMANFLLLAQAGGYDNIMLCSIIFEHIGGYSNKYMNRGGKSFLTEQNRQFAKIIRLLKHLNYTGQFTLPSPVKVGPSLGFAQQLIGQNSHSAEAVKLKKLLGISQHSKYLFLLEHPIAHDFVNKNGELLLLENKQNYKNIVYIRLRSVYSVLIYLGRGVRIPEKDIKAHLTRETYDSHGRVIDWSDEMKDILTVYSSDAEPRTDVLVKVYMNRHWFYIKASDLRSKDTFSAVLRLFTLTLAGASSVNNAPLLTIPVASSRGD